MTNASTDTERRKPWYYLDGLTPKPDAPVYKNDGYADIFCRGCNQVGMAHCAHPEWCGGMEPMWKSQEEKDKANGVFK